jgi:hypothetical protein
METRKTKKTARVAVAVFRVLLSRLVARDGGDMRERLAASFKRARFATDRRVS